MKILITGGAGFIGRHLRHELKQHGHRVSIYDSYDPQVHSRPRSEGRGSVLDYPRLARAIRGAEAVVHFAAAVGVGQSQYQIKHYVDTNIAGTANLLDILANGRHSVRKILVAGSMSAYGEGPYSCKRCGRTRPPLRTQQSIDRTGWNPRCPTCRGPLRPLPTRETDPFVCNSIYAVTKMTQEELVMNFGAAYDIPVVTTRFFNVYGPEQSLSNPYTGAAAIFISRIKNGNPPPIYEDGEQTRDFISVHDIVRACRLCLEKKRADYQVFNVGTGRATSIYELADRLTRLQGATFKPQVLGTFRRGDIRHCYADISKITEQLGFRPKVNLDDGLKELTEWSRTSVARDLFTQAQKELRKRGLA